MLPQIDLETLRERFIQKVHLLSGIKLRPDELRLNAELGTVTVWVGDCKLTEVTLHDDAEAQRPDDLVLRMIFPTRNLQERIVRCKIDLLNRTLPLWSTDIRNSLQQAGVDSELVNNLSFALNYSGYHHTSTGTPAESKTNYPILSVEVDGADDLSISYPIHISEIKDPLDMDDLKNNVFLTILEKTLLGG